MSMIRRADELQQVIDRQVAEGRAASATAFLEEAVIRLIDEIAEEEDEPSGRSRRIGRHRLRPLYDGCDSEG